MKKKILAVVLGLTLCFGMTGCQSVTKDFGGSTTIELEPNQKLEEITWKDDSLWYLTRPMTDDDIAETHTFQQSSNFGVFEGTVTITDKRNIEEAEVSYIIHTGQCTPEYQQNSRVIIDTEVLRKLIV